jgi:uncharacterized protein (TIGR03086 family)
VDWDGVNVEDVDIVGSANLSAGVVDQLRDSLWATAALIGGLPSASLLRPTPCPGWSVLDVVNHLAAVTEKFGRFAAGAPAPIRQLSGDLVGTEPARGFEEVTAVAVAAWRAHPEALKAVCVLPFGSFDGATAAGINLFDAVVHQWDIATGAGIDLDLSDELALVALRVSDLLLTEAARRTGQFSAPVLAAGGARPSVRLLAATGRRPGTGRPGGPSILLDS